MIGTSPAVERIRLHRVSPSLVFADVRIPGVHLHRLKCERKTGGDLKISAPTRTDGTGRTWPCYSLQPGVREAVQAAVLTAWDRIEDRP